MKEYVVQYNNGMYSCGPIAMLNAMRFQGHRATRRHLPWLARKLRVKRYGAIFGTDYMHFERVGGGMGVFKRLRRASNKRVEEQLKKGNGVVVRIQNIDKKTKKCGAHVIFIAAIWIHGDNVKMYVCNLGGGCRWLSWDQIHRYYGIFCDDHWFAAAWTVPPRKKKGVRLVG